MRMSFQQKLFAGAVALAGLLSASRHVQAQDFSLAVSNSPNPILVGNTNTYFINITNTSGFDRFNVFLTNSFSSGVTYAGGTSFLTDAVLTNDTEVVFVLGTFPGGFVEQMVLNFVPTVAGTLTNQITVLAQGRPSVTTNFFTQVTAPTADLGISLTNAATGVFAGDVTSIGLTVTNRGPNAAAGVVVSNTLPLSFSLLSITPANASSTFTNGNLAWNIGTLASGSSTQLFLSVRPTNGGTFSLIASVSAANNTDTNAANNAVTNSMTIGAIIAADLPVSIITPQQFNPQTGLMEEVVRVTNIGTNNVPSFRLLVSGLSTNRLYNAVGTNNGDPFVLHNAELPAGEDVDLLLEYFVWRRVALTNLTRTAQAVTLTPVTVPTNAPPPNITSMQLTAGGFLIEFQSIPGRSYTILYADNMSFSNALLAQPVVVAPADRVQWIDNGPPKTISPPLSETNRFYRVLLNP
jgi:uncharacterized repeat protein (TIGR01451 family)